MKLPKSHVYVDKSVPNSLKNEIFNHFEKINDKGIEGLDEVMSFWEHKLIGSTMPLVPNPYVPLIMYNPSFDEGTHSCKSLNELRNLRGNEMIGVLPAYFPNFKKNTGVEPSFGRIYHKTPDLMEEGMIKLPEVEYLVKYLDDFTPIKMDSGNLDMNNARSSFSFLGEQIILEFPYPNMRISMPVKK